MTAFFLLNVFVIDVRVLLGEDAPSGNPGMKEEGETITDFDEEGAFFLSGGPLHLNKHVHFLPQR